MDRQRSELQRSMDSAAIAVIANKPRTHHNQHRFLCLRSANSGSSLYAIAESTLGTVSDNETLEIARSFRLRQQICL